ENPKSTDIFIATIGENAQARSFKILKDLRENHISADKDHLDRSLKAQFKYSDKINAKYTVVIGDDELSNDEVKLKDMNTSEQTIIKLSELVKELKNRL
ncbi:MAG: His/Gly/Thr/Pro-type tRNA ligase C-terminal domain-containing protein, partial [Paeniclostridium sordellii]|nr:His/Gly/Thr/Pro-type tRNA ligase C-terminal domain-containing protein [Paeniclostridium sordellii]